MSDQIRFTSRVPLSSDALKAIPAVEFRYAWQTSEVKCPVCGEQLESFVNGNGPVKITLAANEMRIDSCLSRCTKCKWLMNPYTEEENG